MFYILGFLGKFSLFFVILLIYVLYRIFVSISGGRGWGYVHVSNELVSLCIFCLVIFLFVLIYFFFIFQISNEPQADYDVFGRFTSTPPGRLRVYFQFAERKYLSLNAKNSTRRKRIAAKHQAVWTKGIFNCRWLCRFTLIIRYCCNLSCLLSFRTMYFLFRLKPFDPNLIW